MAVRPEMIPLEDLVEDILDRRGVTPLKLGSTFKAKGHRVISAKLIKNRSIDFAADDPMFVDDATYRRWMKSGLLKDDVILTSEAPLGETAYIKENKDWCLGQRLFGIRTKKNRLLGRYLFYALTSNIVRNDLVSRSTGTTVHGIRQTELRKIKIPVPVIDEQERIVDILGTLDDKIELNRQINKTLEDTAKAIFKSWFIDFDPVTAKAAGRDTGLPKQIADLFPDSFKDSGLGPIPEGWGLDTFRNHIYVDRGLSYSGDGLARQGEGLPMHNLNSIYEGGGYKVEGLKFYKGEYRERHLVDSGELIVANTEQGFDRLLIGNAAIVPSLYGKNGLFSQDVFRIRFRQTSILSALYLVYLINSPRWHHWISGFSNGTTINHLPIDALEMPLLVIPPVRLIEAFTLLAMNISRKTELNITQISLLGSLRDILLPRLLSGELQVDAVIGSKARA